MPNCSGECSCTDWPNVATATTEDGHESPAFCLTCGGAPPSDPTPVRDPGAPPDDSARMYPFQCGGTPMVGAGIPAADGEDGNTVDAIRKCFDTDDRRGLAQLIAKVTAPAGPVSADVVVQILSSMRREGECPQTALFSTAMALQLLALMCETLQDAEAEAQVAAEWAAELREALPAPEACALEMAMRPGSLVATRSAFEGPFLGLCRAMHYELGGDSAWHLEKAKKAYDRMLANPRLYPVPEAWGIPERHQPVALKLEALEISRKQRRLNFVPVNKKRRVSATELMTPPASPQETAPPCEPSPMDQSELEAAIAEVAAL